MSLLIKAKPDSPLAKSTEPSGDHWTSSGFSPKGCSVDFEILSFFTNKLLFVSSPSFGTSYIANYPSQYVTAKYLPSGSRAPLLTGIF